MVVPVGETIDALIEVRVHELFPHHVCLADAVGDFSQLDHAAQIANSLGPWKIVVSRLFVWGRPIHIQASIGHEQGSCVARARRIVGFGDQLGIGRVLWSLGW